jgi:hypothetical protein
MEGETITHKHTNGSYEVKNSSLEWWSSKTTNKQTVVMQTLSILPLLKRHLPEIGGVCWCKQSKY